MATFTITQLDVSITSKLPRALIMRLQQGEHKLIELSAGAASWPNELVYGTEE